jgi:hypothetical protein
MFAYGGNPGEQNGQVAIAATYTFTASIAGSLMTVTGSPSGLAVGQVFTGTGVPAGTFIGSLGTGSGGNGTYNLGNSINPIPSTLVIASETMTVSGAVIPQLQANNNAIDPNLDQMVVHICATADVFVGKPGVTDTTGFRVPANIPWRFMVRCQLGVNTATTATVTYFIESQSVG